MKASLVPTQSAALPFLVSPLQRGGFMQSDVDRRSVDPFSGWDPQMCYLCPVNNVEKVGC